MTAAITDFAQYTTLRAAADRNDPAALREVAGQFEALFLQTMLKNMREASLADPIFGDSESFEMYQDMMDKQLAVEMASGKGIGLADMLVRQLGREPTSAPPGVSPYATAGAMAGVVSERRTEHSEAWTPEQAESESSEAGSPSEIKRGDVPGNAAAGNAVIAADLGPRPDKSNWTDAAEFAKDVWPHVKRVARALNVAPVAILAQAALETGWGKHVMPNSEGGNSFNLFGIKADSSWTGDAVRKQTIEFEAGVARRETARFRAYQDVSGTFDDYAAFIGDNPRYAAVLNRGTDLKGFARALQASGYATDPAYAEKITRVAESPLMKKVISGLKDGVARSITERLPLNSP